MVIRLRRRALVKAHHDIGADDVLQADGFFRRHEMPGAIQMRGKGDPLLTDLAQIPQGKNLEPAAVGEDGPVPIHKFVQAAGLLDDILPRPQIQMIGIAQDDLGAQGFQVPVVHGLDRSLGADGHENGRLDDAMVRSDAPQTGTSVFFFFYDFVTKHRRS